ncbi:unnamed protein product [Enterobius vermicularis]|uniref:Transposase n=1 Tax=Enterobius vermicularis TaxID=51028 RepID=A0A0N4V039_ENTVE|nr:unnamed protein product [Enterobius vermicularis]
MHSCRGARQRTISFQKAGPDPDLSGYEGSAGIVPAAARHPLRHGVDQEIDVARYSLAYRWEGRAVPKLRD